MIAFTLVTVGDWEYVAAPLASERCATDDRNRSRKFDCLPEGAP
jgi:hypothetical protein